MGLFDEGMPCPLCGEPMSSEQPLFGTWGVWLPSGDPWEPFCDAVMHWTCYAAWEHQQEFALSYFEFWVTERHLNPCWQAAFLDESVLVTVNPSPPVEAAWVYIAATGSRHNPTLDDWDEWLQRVDEEAHSLERSAVAEVKQILRQHVPTKRMLLARITS